jgi:tetratricopeptide (TPR) repeat protein
MSVVYLLAIPAALAIIIGAVCAIARLGRTADKIWLLILGSLFTIIYSIVYTNLKIPYYSTAKAFYGLGAILPISLIFAFGFDCIDSRLKNNKRLFPVRMVLYGWFGTLVLAVLLSFFAKLSRESAAPYLDLDVLAKQGKLSHAVNYYTQLLRNNPDDWDTHYELANAYLMQPKYNDAIEHYKTIIQLRPMWPDALSNLAWALINKPNAALADKTLAVQYAELSCRLTGYLNIQMVSNLADAYVAAGQPAQAITAAEKVIKLAVSAGQHNLVEKTQAWLQRYKMQQTSSKPSP